MASSTGISTRIRIVARLRPRLTHETTDDSVETLVDEDGTAFVAVNHPTPRDGATRVKFKFSSCYGQTSTQEEIFRNDVQPMLDIVYSGVTVTVFAYGVTSSGKTHTMQGTKADPGIIPRAVRALFDYACRTQSSQHQITYSVSYMEIYKDDVFDLLVERDTAPKLPIRENDQGQVFVANLTSLPIRSIDEFEKIYMAASKHRSVGSTNLNHASSRSHAILTINVSIRDIQAGKTLMGKINLVDLAGSENNKHTGNDASRMAESAAINKSLSVLGQVVHSLNMGASRIPYRDSKLTRILQDALGGSAVGLLICNLAPGSKFKSDTWNTLNFASRTKEIENKPVVNVRDNRPLPKSHFSFHPPQPKQVPFPLTTININSSTGNTNALSGPSRLPGPARGRISTFSNNGGVKNGGIAFQPFAMPLPVTSIAPSVNPSTMGGVGVGARLSGEINGNASRLSNGGNSTISIGMGMTEEEIDERISKAVEQEVVRRLAAEREKEKERQSEEEEKRRSQLSERSAQSVNAPQSTADGASTAGLPSGVLTPLLKRHQDLDNELKRRLVELENKYERGNKEAQLADVLSPPSKKKTGRAYVALARAHSEKGDLQVALDLYRKAESYVPDNIKLRERIIEIEYAVKNNITFVPEPTKPKTKKNKAARKKQQQQQRRLEQIEEADIDMAIEGDVEIEGARTDNLDAVNDNEPVPLNASSSSNGRGKKRSAKLIPYLPFIETTNNVHLDLVTMSNDGPELDDAMRTPAKRPRRSPRKKKTRVNNYAEDETEEREVEDWVLASPVKMKV